MRTPHPIRDEDAFFSEHSERTVRAYLWGYLGILVALSLLVSLLAKNKADSFLVLSLCPVSALGAFLLLKWRRPKAAGAMLIGSGWVVITWLMYLGGGMRSYDWCFYTPCVVASGLLFRTKGALLTAALSVLAGMAFVHFEKSLPPSIMAYPSPMLVATMAVTFLLIIHPLHITLTSLHESLGDANRELTRRKQTEGRLLESEQYLRAVLDSISEAVIVHDAETGAVLGTNRRAQELFGVPGPENTPLDLEKIFSGTNHDAEQALVHIRQADEAQALVTEWQARRGDGSLFWAEISFRRALIGGEARVISVCRDITDRKRELGEMKRLIAIIEQMSEDIVLTDLNGVIQYTNPAVEKITGYTRQECLGQKATLFKSGAHDDAYYAGFWKTIKQGRTWTGRITNRHKKGHLVHQDCIVFPVTDEKSVPYAYVAIRRDVTERLALEEQLVQAQKMEAIGTLAGGIAHDFNNILCSIIGFTELAYMDANGNTELTDNLDYALKSCSRAKDLVQQILTFSRRRTQELRSVLLGDVVQEALQLLRPAIPSNIELRVEIQSGRSCVHADQSQLHQILMNLAVNAAHAMKGRNGVITLRCARRDPPADLLAATSLLLAGHILMLEVEDNGSGMSQETLARIFEPFFTTKPQGEGTGLGLAVVHGIVKAHNGILRVDSEEGRGSSFQVYLPVADEEPALESEPEQIVFRGGGKRVLFVDDEDSLCMMMGRLLRRQDLQVDTFHDPLLAEQEFARSLGRPYDLVITDLTMPRLSGLQLAERLQALRPGTRIAIASGRIDADSRREMDRLGVHLVLPKPYSSEAVLALLSRTLGEPVQESAPGGDKAHS